MITLLRYNFIFLFSSISFAAFTRGDIPTTDKKAQLLHNSQGNGICFTPNKGQIVNTDGKLCPDVLYKADVDGGNVFLRKTGISYVFNNMTQVMQDIEMQVKYLSFGDEKKPEKNPVDEQRKKNNLLQKSTIKLHRVDMDFAGCNDNSSTNNEAEIQGVLNFYYAHCPNGVTNVKQYHKVTCNNLYNGIDVSYYGVSPDSKQGLKYDIIVKPYADPDQIKIHWTGADKISLNDKGHLVIKTRIHEFVESIPEVYQVIDGKKIIIDAKYILNQEKNNEGEGIITFKISDYQNNYPLIIDPWASYYGEGSFDHGISIAADTSGNVYVAGYTGSTANIATSTGFQTIFGGGTYDAFLVKFDDTNGTRIWATYYGGTDYDKANSVATDLAGNVYMAGGTCSASGIASTGGFQSVFGGGTSTLLGDAFLVKLDGVTGARLWSTYYGGTGNDNANSVVVDLTGNVYMAGTTASTTGIASSGSFQAILGGNSGGSSIQGDAFLVKFDASGARLWGTYYGGTNGDVGASVTTDAFGNVYMTGSTTSTSGIASPGGFQTVYVGGYYNSTDAFLSKFDGGGTRLWGTYYGGTDVDEGTSLATDIMGNVYMAGYTSSATGIASPGGFQTVYVSGYYNSTDAFLSKFDGAGARLWATYYGEADDDWCATGALVTDGKNNVYLYMEAEDVPTPSLVDPCTYQPTFNGIEDQLIVKFSPDGNKLCSTYMGGTAEDDLDGGGGMAISGNSIYITGYTMGGGYPVTASAFQTVYGGGVADVFVASLCTNICEGKILGVDFFSSVSSGCMNDTITYAPNIVNSCDTSGYIYNWTFSGGIPSSSSLASPKVIYPQGGTYDVKLVVSTICKKDSLTKSMTIGEPPTIAVVGSDTTICENMGMITANVPAIGTGAWTLISGSGAIANPSSPTSAVTDLAIGANVFQWTITNAPCPQTSDQVIITLADPLPASAGNDTAVCPGESVPLHATDGVTYNWSPATALTCTDCQNPVATSNDSITYCVVITDKDGCLDSACIKINIECQFFYIANAFTANGDGKNEVFKPEVMGVHDYRFLIFDRWGEKVFETTDINEGWDGYYKGKFSPQDVYVYKIVFYDDIKNKLHEYIGKVTLVR